MESIAIVLMSGETLDLKVGGYIDISEVKRQIRSIDYNKGQTAIEIGLEGEIGLEDGFTWGIPLQTILNYSYS